MTVSLLVQLKMTRSLLDIRLHIGSKVFVEPPEPLCFANLLYQGWGSSLLKVIAKSPC